MPSGNTEVTRPRRYSAWVPALADTTMVHCAVPLRHASEMIDQLTRHGVVNASGEVVSLPAHRAELFLPGLFPEQYRAERGCLGKNS
jgi:hypothetical protein